MKTQLRQKINRLKWNAHLRSQPLPSLVKRSVIMQANLLRRSGDYEGTLNLLNKVEGTKNDPYALNIQALAKLGQEDHEGALTDFRSTENILLIRLSKACQNQAATLLQMKRFDEAIQSVLRAINFSASYPSPWVTYLAIYCLSSRSELIPEIVSQMNAKWPAWPQSVEFRQYLNSDPDLKPARLHPLFQQILQ